MKQYTKKPYPIENVRRFLEPGPVVLVSSAWKGEKDIMTMGWHMIMGFTPSLIGCYIGRENFSHHIIRKSRECVINLPTTALIEETVAVGNCSGSEFDKFSSFGLTPSKSLKISAPSIKECFANFECQLYETKMIGSYNLFIFEVVHAEVATSPKLPETFHYRGDGLFMISGGKRNLKSHFKPEML